MTAETFRKAQRRAKAALSGLIATPATITNGGTYTLKEATELHVVMRTAIVGTATFATVRGKNLHLKDIAINGKVKLGFFEKNTVFNFASSAGKSFDLHVKTSSIGTTKVAGHL